MKKLGFPLVVIGIVGVMVILFAVGNKPEKPQPESELVGTKHENEGSTHVPDGTHVEYKTNPPNSGNHYGTPAPWGVKDSELPDETLVHNLEHGGILIAYKPCSDQFKEGCLNEDQVNELKKVAEGLPQDSRFNEQKFVLVPRTKNDHAIALAAWTYTYTLDSIDASKITQFYNDHVNKGPELIP